MRTVLTSPLEFIWAFPLTDQRMGRPDWGQGRILMCLWCTLLMACSRDELVPDLEPEVPWRTAPAHWPEMQQPEGNELNLARWELGKRLFFDPVFSIDGSVSCASCHLPEAAFGSVTSTSPGANNASGTRNAPALVNVGYLPYFLREGGVPTLELQALVPIQAANEFHHNIIAITELLAADESYVNQCFEAYGEGFSAYTITRALGAFQRGLVGGHSAFDQWLQGDEGALSEAALSGMQLFHEIGCDRCHSGHLFTDHRIVNNGLLADYADTGLERLTGNPGDIGKFKVPSLRNVALTAPYMFNGSLPTLDAVLEHYRTGGQNHPNQAEEIVPLTLSDADLEHLKAFLNALTDHSFIAWSKDLVP